MSIKEKLIVLFTALAVALAVLISAGCIGSQPNAPTLAGNPDTPPCSKETGFPLPLHPGVL